jgi:hypothetical protein
MFIDQIRLFIVYNYKFLFGSGQGDVNEIHILGDKVRMFVILRDHHFVAETQQYNYIIL